MGCMETITLWNVCENVVHKFCVNFLVTHAKLCKYMHRSCGGKFGICCYRFHLSRPVITGLQCKAKVLLVCDLYLSVFVVKCWNISCLCDFSDCMCPQLFCRSFCDHRNCVLSTLPLFSMIISFFFFFSSFFSADRIKDEATHCENV